MAAGQGAVAELVTADAAPHRNDELVTSPGESKGDGKARDQRLGHSAWGADDLDRPALRCHIEPAVRAKRHGGGSARPSRLDIGGKDGGRADAAGGRQVGGWGKDRER